MDIGSILIGLALTVMVGALIAQPFIERRGMREKQVTAAEALLAEREALLVALRDLDFDHAVGKITTEDYTPQRAQLAAQAVAVLKQMDALGLSPATETVEAQIERAVASRRAAAAPPTADAQMEAAIAARRQTAPAGGAVCAHCHTPAGADDRFCAKCGRALPAAAACAQCGTRLQPNDRFCAKCGAAVAVPQPAGVAE